MAAVSLRSPSRRRSVASCVGERTIATPEQLTEFRVEIPEAELRDLRERLAHTRWPEQETVEDWSQGVPRAYLMDLCRYWGEEYDWRKTEARLNAVPQSRTLIDGLAIHFI